MKQKIVDAILERIFLKQLELLDELKHIYKKIL